MAVAVAASVQVSPSSSEKNKLLESGETNQNSDSDVIFIPPIGTEINITIFRLIYLCFLSMGTISIIMRN